MTHKHYDMGDKYYFFSKKNKSPPYNLLGS